MKILKVKSKSKDDEGKKNQRTKMRPRKSDRKCIYMTLITASIALTLAMMVYAIINEKLPFEPNFEVM